MKTDFNYFWPFNYKPVVNTMKVVEFQQKPNEDLIAFLEERLKEAKSGEIVTAALVALKPDGKYKLGHSPLNDSNVVAIVGALQILSSFIATKELEEFEE